MQDQDCIISVKPKGRGHLARDTLITFLMWGVYIYLWIPLITFAAWAVGFDRFYEVMIVYGGFDVVMGLLDWYALIIILIAACVVGWSEINYRRFHNSDRRYTATAAKAREISEFFNVTETEIERARSSRRLQIELDESGNIAAIKHFAYLGADDHLHFVELE